MSDRQETPWVMIEEVDANREVSTLYEKFKRDYQLPTVPNYIKALGHSPSMLQFYYDMMLSFYQNLTLPQSLISMIQFAVAKHAECEYCSAVQEVTCRTLGVDAETLNIIIDEVSELNPERVRAIIEFSLKVSKYPQSVSTKDFQSLRDMGITDDEIVQIANVTSVAVYLDTMADTFKVEVDKYLADALDK